MLFRSTPVRLVEQANLAAQTAAGLVAVLAFPASLAALPERPGLARRAAPESAAEYARELYAGLRALDAR